MKLKFTWSILMIAACLFGASNLAAKATVVDSGNYTTKDKEFYLTTEQILFVRPGLELEILDVVIPSDRQTEVTFRITDPAGLELDREGVYTPGPVSTSFILAYIPAGEEAYMSYTKRTQTSPITGNSAEQASTDSGGTYTDLGGGMYMYKFGTVLPEGYAMDVTHTLGIYARRDLTEFDLDRYVSNELEHFVPSGSGMPMPREVVTTETCNGRCHDPLAIHGGSRQEVGLCILCHNPNQDIDPDTGNSFDMPLMTHKIHMGENLANGYNIIGYRQSDHDYSHVVYPADINDCEMCHTGGVPTKNLPLVATPNPVLACDMNGRGATTISWGSGLDTFELYYTTPDGLTTILLTTWSSGEAASLDINGWAREGSEFAMVDFATGETIQEIVINTTILGCSGNAPGTPRGVAGVQHTSWMENPTRKNCGSCHDYINWETGEGHSANEWPQDDDNLCAICHFPDSGGEYDMSVNAAHQVWWKSTQMPGVLVELVDITNTGPGERPTVTFTVGSKYSRLNPNGLDRLRFILTGPNTDFDFYEDETVDNNAVAVGGGVWSYTFDTPLPTDAMGSYTVSVEGRNNADIDTGLETISERDAIENPMLAFAVTDDSAKPRRVIVDDAKCESCHNNVSLHGDNRKNAQYCVTCHSPNLVDIQDPAESVNQKWMIHKIHRGADLENGYVVVRSRGTYDFSHVEYTGDLRNCEKCHVNGSEQLPLSAGQLPQVTPNFWWDPVGPTTSACLSCHDGDDATSHALANTTFVGESCSTCHGEGKDAAVDKVHAR